MDGHAIPHWYDPEGAGGPLTLVDGEDSTVYDDEGNAYLDFMAQLYCVNAGHSNGAIVEAMTEQASRIPYVSSAKGNDARDRLASMLVERAPASLTDVHFSVSGSEANEIAVQVARAYQDAPKVLTRWRSYHGSTYGAAALTGDPETRAEVERYGAASGVSKFLPPLEFGGPFPAETPEELAEQAADHLEWVIRNEGPDSVAALITEPVAGTSGAYPAPPGYFERVREICDEYDVLLVSDEVIAGFGRCGDWFGIQTEGVEPDVITFAKGVTSAYAPLAGALVSEEISEYLGEEGTPLGQTFAGHPVACAAGVAAVEAYEGGLFDNARDLAPTLEERLRAVETEFDVVGDVHGRGLLWGVEFADPETGEHLFDPRVDEGDNPVAAVREEARERGVLFGSARPDVQLVLSPPLCVTEAEVDEAVGTLRESIGAVF
ncbi:aspartate aminotransferase family protein [Halobaculum sp. EA56]|uniref:aminotransferase family protein n=1 Tax=Halobaculum sp. EA56 TaxID=3421648 RepID=UPI003EBFB1DF